MKKRLWELIAAPFSESSRTSELRVRRIEGLRSCGKLLFNGQQTSHGAILKRSQRWGAVVQSHTPRRRTGEPLLFCV